MVFMPFRLRLTLIFFVLLLLSVVIVPLLFPVPELITKPVRELAGANARFAEVSGVDLHYTDLHGTNLNSNLNTGLNTEAGRAQPALVLLHGFSSSTFSWRKVAGPLSANARVVAFDRPGFGFTERPAVTKGANPYTPQAQVDLTLGLLDRLNLERAVLVGSSAGGAVAVQLALAHPERVAGLVLVDPVLSSGGPPAWVRGLLNTPQASRLGPYFMRQQADQPGLELLRRAYADPAQLTAADLAGFERPWQSRNWDVALWEVTKATRPTDLFPQLASLNVPTLVVNGAADGVVPPELSARAAAAIPGAEHRVLKDCGHLPQEECPQKFLAAVTPWLNTLPETTAGQ